jgi:hypothetical protein
MAPQYFAEEQLLMLTSVLFLPLRLWLPPPASMTQVLTCWPAPIFALLLRLLQDGWTALHCAASTGYKNVVAQLLGAGAAVDAPDKVRPSPCWWSDWVRHDGLHA